MWESVDNGPPTHEPSRTHTPEPELPTTPENDAMEQHFDALHADASTEAQEQTDTPQECADTVGAMDEEGEPTMDSVGDNLEPTPTAHMATTKVNYRLTAVAWIGETLGGTLHTTPVSYTHLTLPTILLV